MVKPGFQEWGLMAVIILLFWMAIGVPFIMPDDVARFFLISMTAGAVAFAPRFHETRNQVVLDRIRRVGDLAGGLLMFLATFFGLSSILPKLTGVEILFAFAIFGVIVLLFSWISIQSHLNIRNS